MKADYYYIALRGASIRRSRCGNSEAIVGVVERWGTEVQLRNKIKSLIANDFVALIASYRSICRSSADLKEDICLCIFTNIAVSVEVLSYGDI